MVIGVGVAVFRPPSCSNSIAPVGVAMTHGEQQYLTLLQDLLEHGDERVDRTGVGTKALFGREMRFDLASGFPVFTTKRVYWKTAFKEMLWMLGGGSNIRELLEQGVRIWTDWPLQRYREATGERISQEAFENGFSRTTRSHRSGAISGLSTASSGADGVRATAVKSTRSKASSTADQERSGQSPHPVGWLERRRAGPNGAPALPQTVFLFRSIRRDAMRLGHPALGRQFPGLPWNVANLALVTTLLAEQTGLRPGEIAWYGLDVHLYLNHVEQAKEQLARSPRPFPTLRIKRRPPTLFDYRIEDFEMVSYDPHPRFLRRLRCNPWHCQVN